MSLQPSSPEIPPAIQAVVVLYRIAPEESAALRGLLAALARNSAAAAAMRVLLYDNSPEPHAWTPPRGIVTEYVHNPANGGLLAAYNHALTLAQHNGAPWLLLLDDDTHVTVEFVQQQLQMVDHLAARPDVGAVVPKLRSAGVVQSPHGPVGWRQAPLAVRRAGPAPVGATAFNSGAMLRRAAVEAVGGFPDGYPLDFLDHAMFARLARAGFRVWVLPATLDHPMTWENPERAMGFDRFARVLQAEQRFHREYGGLQGALIFRLRCARRAWRYRQWDDKRFAQACWRMARG
jgi:GT2 family glycosyltransferase